MLQTIQGYSQTTYIQNGSFENYDNLPTDITLVGIHAYATNQFMYCLSFWNVGTPYPWGPQMKYTNFYYNLDQSETYWTKLEGTPPNKCNSGWYTPTLMGTPDYFHINGEGRARAPYVNALRDCDEAWEYRYPYGYYQGNNSNSAFAGIRIDNIESQMYNVKEYKSYKEYIQQKLFEPLPPGKYNVSFYVSRSQKASFSVNQLGAFFSQDPITNFRVENGKENSKNRNYWKTNLAQNDTDPYNFIYYPQVTNKADILLDQHADENGHDGWMKIEGELNVPLGYSYNYITIGNFQQDSYLYDSSKQDPTNKDIYPFDITYYFIDNISITSLQTTPDDCNCQGFIPPISQISYSDIFTLSDSEGDECCYNYSINVPSISEGVCSISKFTIEIDNNLIKSEEAPNGTYLNGNKYTGTVCSENQTNFKTIRIKYFAKDANQNYSLLEDCTYEKTYKCKCSCSDIKYFPYIDEALSFQLIKKQTSNPFECCWDLFISNPPSSTANSCLFDLSNYKLFVTPKGTTNPIYTLSDGNFEATNNPQKYWTIPNNFKIPTDSYIHAGQLCINSIYYPSFTEFDFDLYQTDEQSQDIKCKTVLTQQLNCFPSDFSCWGLLSFFHKDTCGPNEFDILLSDLNYPNNNPNIKCNFPMYLRFNFSPDSCFYWDSLYVEIYPQEDPDLILYQDEFVIKDLYYRDYFLTKLRLYGADSKILCAKIVNKTRQDSLIFTDTLVCPDNSFEKYYRPDEVQYLTISELKIIPNPVSSELKISFDSGYAQEVQFQLCNLMGDVILTDKIQCIKGLNNQTMLIKDIPNGSYYLKIVKDNKVLTEKLIKID